MKNIEKIIKKTLSEEFKKSKPLNEESKIEDLYFFTSLGGGVLGIPKKLNPQNMTFVDKSKLLSVSKDWVLNEWFSWGNPSPKDICETHYSDMDMDLCIAKGYDAYVSRLANGGVKRFTANHPKTGVEKKWLGCLNVQKDGVPLKFDEFIFAGYYTDNSGTGACDGEIWSIETPKAQKDKVKVSFTSGDAEESEEEPIVELYSLKINIIFDK